MLSKVVTMSSKVVTFLSPFLAGSSLIGQISTLMLMLIG